MGAELAVEVGTNADHHGAGKVEQRVDEVAPLSWVVAQREQLLELVDDHQLAGFSRDVQPGVGARRQQTNAVDPLDLAGLDGGSHSGPEDRGLAAARGAHEGHEPAGSEAIEKVPHHVLAPEEVRAVLRPEGQQAAIRTVRDGKGCVDAGSLERVDPLRSGQSLQAVRSDVHQLAALGQARGDEVRAHGRQEDLAYIGLAAKPRREIDRGPEVVGPAALRLAGVDPEASGDVKFARPRLGGQRPASPRARPRAPAAQSRRPTPWSRPRPWT